MKKSIPGKKITVKKAEKDWFVATAGDVTSPLDLIRGITNLILDGWDFEVIQFSKRKLTKKGKPMLEQLPGETDGEFAARQAEAEAAVQETAPAEETTAEAPAQEEAAPAAETPAATEAPEAPAAE